ncbi:MAG: hypothetical protein IPO12_11850 [Flavobacteriales bacterium]|nr:hypothetical protein [Flavobacteriales bacterium]MBP6644044.1 hypothetical protein [Flavobacteriales bacterium]MBP7409598.1 hypothetical protein [Flavobacteriales bacterium]
MNAVENCLEEPSAEKYLRCLLRTTLQGSTTQFVKEGPNTTRQFGQHDIVLDGTIGDKWVVELEARTLKQVRGVIVDLMLHERTKKLLVVLVEEKGKRTAATVQEHLYKVIDQLEQERSDWCIVGLPRPFDPSGHRKELDRAFRKAGILR